MIERVQIRSVTFNERNIEYTLTKKQVKNINLRIKSNGEVFVSASYRTSVKTIDEFVLKKADFIVFHVDNFKKNQKDKAPVKKYITGESILILGKNIILKVIESSDESVLFDGIYIILRVKNINDYTRKEKLMTRFINNYCDEFLKNVVNQIYPVFSDMGITYPVVKLRNMTTRWGSCAVIKKQITLNKKLIKTPIKCIEYVVLHEFSHFIHPNHSKAFYDFVANLMPDWEERKKLLDTYSAE